MEEKGKGVWNGRKGKGCVKWKKKERNVWNERERNVWNEGNFNQNVENSICLTVAMH